MLILKGTYLSTSQRITRWTNISVVPYNKVLPNYIYSFGKLTKSTGSRIGKVRKHKKKSSPSNQKPQDRKEDSKEEEYSKRERSHKYIENQRDKNLKNSKLLQGVCNGIAL